jgi:glucose-6-phosphate 1-dehydrogenase
MILPKMESRRGTVLIIRPQPDEGIALHATDKEPGRGGVRLAEVKLDMTFSGLRGVGAADETTRSQ